MNQMPVSIILNINKEDTFQAAEKGGRDKTKMNGEGGGGGSWKSGIRERVRKLRKLRSS